MMYLVGTLVLSMALMIASFFIMRSAVNSQPYSNPTNWADDYFGHGLICGLCGIVGFVTSLTAIVTLSLCTCQ